MRVDHPHLTCRPPTSNSRLKLPGPALGERVGRVHRTEQQWRAEREFALPACVIGISTP